MTTHNLCAEQTPSGDAHPLVDPLPWWQYGFNMMKHLVEVLAHRRVLLALSSGLLLAALAGCSLSDEPSKTTEEETTPSGIPVAPYQVWFGLSDLSTNMATTPIQVYVGPAPVEAAKLDLLAQSLKLRRVSPAGNVPFTVEIMNPGQTRKDSSDGSFVVPTHEPATLTVKPDSPLEPTAWYVLLVDGVDDPELSFPFTIRPVEGIYSVRFTPGSRPTMAGIEMCRHDAGSFSAGVFLSENVISDNAEVPDLLEVHFDGTQCDVVTDRTYPSIVNPQRITFECATNAGSEVVVILREGLVSASGGGALSTYTGRTAFEEVLNLDTLPVAGNADRNGCPFWSPE